MIHALALALVACAALFLVVLGLVALLRPPLARSFLSGFASSPTKHYAELAVRFAIGCALVRASPALPGAAAFSCFGWLLLATTGVMVFIPWRRHQAFAQASVPKALGYLPAVGLTSLAAGVGMLWAITGAVGGAA